MGQGRSAAKKQAPRSRSSGAAGKEAVAAGDWGARVSPSRLAEAPGTQEEPRFHVPGSPQNSRGPGP